MNEKRQPPLRPAMKGALELTFRSRVQPFRGLDEWHEVVVRESFPVSETALLLCDVWNKHWCDGATQRVNEMAPRMEQVAQPLRERGVQIVHAPSDTMDFYEGTEQRLRLLAASLAEPPEPLDLTNPPLPIDDSDGGCETDQEPYKAWDRQHQAIEIGEYDGISDDGREVYNLFAQLGVRNMLIMGVHTNMCVLNRSFSIRQMTKWGIRVVLIRDLTDAMYNPARAPYASHQEGTELVIQHIEKYWCPTTLSDDLLR